MRAKTGAEEDGDIEGALSDQERVKACSEDKFFHSNGISETFTHSPRSSEAAGSVHSHVEVGLAFRSEGDERVPGFCSCLPLQG